MRIFGIAIAALMLIFGFRLITVAFRAAVSSQVMVRDGVRYKWQPVPSDEAWKRALRDGLMGLLLIVLSIVMMI